MAGLDPSIILRDISPKFEPYENVLAKQMQIKAQQQQYDDNAFKLQQDRETSQQQNALAQFMSTNPNLNDPATQAKLYGVGGVKLARDQIKSIADVNKIKGETDAKAAEAEAKVLALHRDALAEIQNPQDMAKWMVAIRKDPRTQSFYERMGSAEEAIARIPQTPQEFNTFRDRIALGMKDYVLQNKPTFTTRNLGGTTETLATEGMTGNTRVINSSSNTQSPDNKASNERMALDNAASRQVQMRGQNMVDSRSRESNAISGGYSSKPMPATALKMQNEALDVVGSASSTQANLTAMQKQIDSGKLSFGPISNAINQGRNMAGLSNEESRNFSSFKSNLEKLRNDSLRLNKGVQTDGDAQRAWNELFQNINDTKLVSQRLNEIKAINARAVDLRKREVEDVRNNYKQAPYDFGTQTNAPAAVGLGGNSPNIDSLLQKYAK